MTLGELKQYATKIIEEYSSGGDNFTTDGEVSDKMIPSINATLSILYGLDSSIKLTLVTKATPNTLELGVDAENSDALGIATQMLGAMPYGVASGISDDWNFVNYCNQKFQEILQFRKPKIRIIEGNPRCRML